MGPRLKGVARSVLFPWRAGWSAANRLGVLGETQVGSSPHLDPNALDRWRELVRSADVYLEYGSGGSTVEAAQTVRHLISVESDRQFLAAVERQVSSTPASAATLYPVHVDIGLTEKWGRPLIEMPTAKRLRRWRQYSSAPWLLLNELRLTPQFIFIDGRFRVASVLDSLLHLPVDVSCWLMLDDFHQRQASYRAILPFIGDSERVGRALVFRRHPQFDRSECARQLEIAQRDPE